MNDASNTPGTSNTASNLMSLALGAVVGAGIALLLAPESGKRTRQRLASTARRWTNAAGHAMDQARDTASELGADAKSAIKAGQDAFTRDRAARETRSEHRTSHSNDPAPGLLAAKSSQEEMAR